jgi:hypothetical protein
MKQKLKILFFCMILVAKGAFCQKLQPDSNVVEVKKTFYISRNILLMPPVIPANFYCTQLGFFCRKEWKLESVTKVPFRFRLGSVSYNDWLEGKKNAGILPAP